MSELLKSIITNILDENNPDIMKPIIKSFMIGLTPYLIGFLFINFFLTVGANSLILYIYRINYVS